LEGLEPEYSNKDAHKTGELAGTYDVPEVVVKGKDPVPGRVEKKKEQVNQLRLKYAGHMASKGNRMYANFILHEGFGKDMAIRYMQSEVHRYQLETAKVMFYTGGVVAAPIGLAESVGIGGGVALLRYGRRGGIMLFKYGRPVLRKIVDYSQAQAMRGSYNVVQDFAAQAGYNRKHGRNIFTNYNVIAGGLNYYEPKGTLGAVANFSGNMFSLTWRKGFRNNGLSGIAGGATSTIYGAFPNVVFKDENNGMKFMMLLYGDFLGMQTQYLIEKGDRYSEPTVLTPFIKDNHEKK